MEDKNKEMRAGDLIIAALFFLLGCFILIVSFQMPLTGSYGGVESAWYVSPALCPIIIGDCIILLSISVFTFALKHDGLVMLKEKFAERRKEPLFNEDTLRFLSVLVPMFGLVYVDIKRMDLLFSVFLYLAFTIAVFYIDDSKIRKNTLIVYSICMVLNVILSVVKFEDLFLYAFDVIGLIESVILVVTLLNNIKKSEVEDKKAMRKKVRTSCLVAGILPVFIEIVFRFGLRVPMPCEGSMMNLLYLVYYAIR
jgi:hypothetical protein